MTKKNNQSATLLTAAHMKSIFFDAFGEMMTMVESIKAGAGLALPLMADEVQCLRDCVMLTRERFLVNQGDTEDQWWQITEGLAKLTNRFDYLDLDGLAQFTYVLASAASHILSIWKEEKNT